jgi:hypothetical protein
VKWATEGRAGANAALQIAGTNLIVLTTEGDLIVAGRNPEKFEELHRYKVAESQTWAQPVLMGAQLLVRDATNVTSWSLR